MGLLEPSISDDGHIVYWYCSDCNWRFTPVSPVALSQAAFLYENARSAFRRHNCQHWPKESSGAAQAG
jgi:hypothetical protein